MDYTSIAFASLPLFLSPKIHCLAGRAIAGERLAAMRATFCLSFFCSRVLILADLATA
jgi:hypothetical protein